jgi:hypothetical protein
MNSALRGIHAIVPKSASEINALNSELRELPPIEGISFRGARFEAAGFTREKILSWKKGTIFTEDAFMSTSVDRERGLYHLYDQPGVLFVVEGKTGRYIGDISKIERDREILFMSGTVFEVVDINAGEKIVEVTVREVQGGGAMVEPRVIDGSKLSSQQQEDFLAEFQDSNDARDILSLTFGWESQNSGPGITTYVDPFTRAQIRLNEPRPGGMVIQYDMTTRQKILEAILQGTNYVPE